MALVVIVLQDENGSVALDLTIEPVVDQDASPDDITPAQMAGLRAVHFIATQALPDDEVEANDDAA